MDGKGKIEKKKNPREDVNLLSALTFAWILKTFWVGYKRDLETDDLTRPLKEHKSSILGEKISAAWENELKRVNFMKDNGKNRPSLMKALIKMFGAKILLYGLIYAILEIVSSILQPIILGRLLRYYSRSPEEQKTTKSEPYLWSGGLIICLAINRFVYHPYSMAISHIGMKIRVACCSLIYRKSLRLSKTALDGKTVGHAVNLLSNDVSRFDSTIPLLNYLWIGPLETIIVTFFIYDKVGVSAIVGVASLLMFIPLQGWFGKRSSVLRLKTAIRTDERVRLTNEIVTGIQAIKMYTWENPFSKFIEEARRREINVIRSASYIKGVADSFAMFVTKLSLYLTIIVFVCWNQNYKQREGSNKIITAEKIFMVTAYYNLLRQNMTFFFPQALVRIAELSVSIKRIREFMMYDEVDFHKPKESGNVENYRQLYKNFDEVDGVQNVGSIFIKKLNAKWSARNSKEILNQITLEIKPGELVAIVGYIGSGKSSLLNVILKELAVNQGSVIVRGNIAYACQEPWLFGGSVRTNILFGREMDQTRYDQVVKVCQLKRDFQLLPYGDRTIIGERGIILSGGQKARINLARAVYTDASIYLLDDPLNAVDAHVGKKIFKQCIEQFLEGKTRILVTHQIQFLRNVTRIIVMKDGTILAEGSYDDLVLRGIDFGRLTINAPSNGKDPDFFIANKNMSRKCSIISQCSVISNGYENDDQKEPDEDVEITTKGNVHCHNYSMYFKAGGNCCVLITILLLFVGGQFFISTGDYFVAWWVNLEERLQNSTLIMPADSRSLIDMTSCVYILAGITVGIVVITLLRYFVFMTVCMKASRRLHDQMFRSISRATMRFFYTNSSSRILNRFSRDMGVIDELLPLVLAECVQLALCLVGMIIILVIKNFWLIIPSFVTAIISYYATTILQSTSRSVKRLEGVTRSPVYNHLNATVQGLSTIRSFDAAQVLLEEFDRHQDLHSSAWFFFLATSRAFGLWLDTLCMFFISLVILSLLVQTDNENSLTRAGDVGLTITQSIGLIGMLQWELLQIAELENQMTSVERVVEYTNLESEPPLESSPDKKPEENWPLNGNIEFRNLSLSYDPLDPPVLKNLNFIINGREKVGIVGRTGAGKSSLISALFRLANLEGSIIIDEVDTQDIGLHDLRSKISIIPQEPFLFSGTLRRNLDPFDSYPDSLLWSALEEVELKEMNLQAHINEGGSNLSVGQRQLVCLARSIISNNKILILDEATANVDPRTDELIQKTICRKFVECTVLTIAHRLNTVMDSDRILVMDAGTVQEFDHPYLLLQNPNGALSSMIKETGKNMADALAAVAKENYKLRQHQATTAL